LNNQTDNEPQVSGDTGNDNYIQHVSDIGDKEKVSLSEDIYSSFGVLLLRKGCVVNKNTISALTKHKLDKPIDTVLAISDSVTNLQISKAVEKSLEEFPAFIIMSQAISNLPRLLNCIRQVELNTTMRNKISITYKAMPHIFDHAIRVAICSVMLGMYMGLSDEDCDILAMAGLFHDLGEMHIDPELLKMERSLNDQELKFVYAHPAIIYNILTDLAAYNSDVAQAVLEHHERIGGHGYPRGIKQYSNIYAAILAVAEVLTSMCERNSLERTIITLKYNQGHFEKKVLDSFLSAMLQTDYKNANTVEEIEKEQNMLVSIISSQQVSLNLLIKDSSDLINEDSSFQLLTEKLKSLPPRLYRSGIDISKKDPLHDFRGDPESSYEATSILQETLYLMRDFHRDYARRLPPTCTDEKLIEWHKQAVEEIHSYKTLQTTV
jgi:HD-GYP domain-containing protein (c-di-GMP phosphodiesterase class II)